MTLTNYDHDLDQLGLGPRRIGMPDIHVKGHSVHTAAYRHTNAGQIALPEPLKWPATNQSVQLSTMIHLFTNLLIYHKPLRLDMHGAQRGGYFV